MDEFPSELLYRIADLIDDGPQCLPLRLASRRFNAIFTPVLIQRVLITIPRGPPSIVIQNKEGSPVREIPFHSIPQAFVATVSLLHVIIRLEQFDFVVDDFVVDAALLDELSRFTRLKGLHISSPDLSRDQAPLIDSILERVVKATNGGIVDILLKPIGTHELITLPNALTNLRRLESIQLSHSCPSRHRLPHQSSPEFLTQLRSIIESNPSLHTLEYSFNCQNNPISLHDILPPTLTSMALRKFHIDGYFAPLPSAPMLRLPLPTLHYLQHLDLVYEESASVPMVLSANVDQLWVALTNTQVALKTLRTAYISPSLLSYLVSFRGLKECRFCLPSSPQYVCSAASIYHALATHARSIEELHISTVPDHLAVEYDGFIFSLSNLPSSDHDLAWIQPSAFPRLRALSIITLDQADPNNHPIRPQGNPNPFGDFFSKFPALSKVFVSCYSADPFSTQRRYLACMKFLYS